MGHSDIGVTMNTYTHLGLDDAKNEMIRMEELEQARKEVDKTEGKKPMRQNMFKVVWDKRKTLRDLDSPWALFLCAGIVFVKKKGYNC